MNKLILLAPFLLLMLMGIAGAATPSAIPSGIQYYVPINLTNSESTATSAPFQQMVNITESTYSSYIAYSGSTANFEYFYSNGTIIPAWIESNSSGVLRVWVKLPNGIPANSKVTLYLGFAKIGSFQPKGFTAPEDFYVVKDRVGCFISYRQGFDEVFYAPEVAT